MDIYDSHITFDLLLKALEPEIRKTWKLPKAFTVNLRIYRCLFDRSRACLDVAKRLSYAKVDSIRSTSSKTAMNLSPSCCLSGSSGRRGVML